MTKTVCSACRTEACAAGDLMCEDARRAGILVKRPGNQGRRSVVEIASRIDQIIGWAKDGARSDHYLMDREKVDRMRADILSYAFGEAAIGELEKS